jgi:putative hydrolase
MRFPVDPHTHTVASSHAYSTISEYAAEARRKGVRLFASTDHGPSLPDAPHAWHFGNLHVVPRLLAGVGVLRGIEANVLDGDGRVDVPEEAADRLDLVLASLHEPVFPPATRAEHTRALVNAIRGSRVDVIGHAGNPNFPIDIEAVVRAAVEHRVALEINNSSFRGSRKGSGPNCRAIAEAARDLGALVVMGSDAHFAASLGDFSEAWPLLEEVRFPAERILNASPGAFLDFLERRGHAAIPELAALRG